MLNKRSSNFAELVWDASHRLGSSATRIADEIIATAFPKTVEEAGHEGADKMLRHGVVAEVKRILTRTSDADGQIDMSSIDKSFGEIVGRLKKGKYFVEELDEYVSVADLIKNPEYLGSARDLMLRKGEECLAEARTLGELYDAITSSGDEV